VTSRKVAVSRTRNRESLYALQRFETGKDWDQALWKEISTSARPTVAQLVNLKGSFNEPVLANS